MFKVYGASWCPGCRMAKVWFTENKIEYQYVDIETEEGMVDFTNTTNVRTIPLIVKGDTHIVGFNPPEIMKIVEANKDGKEV